MIEPTSPASSQSYSKLRYGEQVTSFEWTHKAYPDKCSTVNWRLGPENKAVLKKRFKDQLKANLKWADLKSKDLEPAASDRTAWRALTHMAANDFEDDRRRHLEPAREL